MNKYLKLIPAIMVMFLLFGCGKKSDIISSDLVQNLTDNVAFTEQLTEISSNNAETRYGLDSKDYIDIMAVIGTAATCDEIVIVKTDDTDNVMELLNQYLENKQEEYDKYRPDEASKLSNPIIEVHNNTITMIISGDSQTAIDAYNEYLRK